MSSVNSVCLNRLIEERKAWRKSRPFGFSAKPDTGTVLDLAGPWSSVRIIPLHLCRLQVPSSLVCRSLNQSPAHLLLHLMYHRSRRGGRLDSLVVHRPWKGRNHLGGCRTASDDHIFQCLPCETTPSRISEGILPSKHLSKWYSVSLHLE